MTTAEALALGEGQIVRSRRTGKEAPVIGVWQGMHGLYVFTPAGIFLPDDLAAVPHGRTRTVPGLASAR
jgi:hypothetical protein